MHANAAGESGAGVSSRPHLEREQILFREQIAECYLLADIISGGRILTLDRADCIGGLRARGHNSRNHGRYQSGDPNLRRAPGIGESPPE